jgi:hypothetical protein
VLTVPTAGTTTLTTCELGSFWPLNIQLNCIGVRLTAVAERTAVPPFWTATPKGWTAMIGGVPICAWHFAVKKAKNAKQIAAFPGQYALTLSLAFMI